jgi:hypothetical protein
MRIDHVNGCSVFIEIKQKHAKVSIDGKSLSHLQNAVGFAQRGIFTFEAKWDYLLTMTDDKVGYLIRKDDIPRCWWHQVPGPDNWLKYEFPDQSFLENRRVLLDSNTQTIVRTFARILAGNGSLTSSSMVSKLTAKDICAIAGPCPLSLLGMTTPEGITMQDFRGLEPDHVLADEHVSVLNENEAGDSLQPLETIDRAFESAPADDRFKLVGGLDDGQDATLFVPLMVECRRT